MFYLALSAHKGLFTLKALLSMTFKINIKLFIFFFSGSILNPAFTRKGYSKEQNKPHSLSNITIYMNLS